MKFSHKHPFSLPKQGFALIATISVMVLLVMIALAMLSLSTIELRQASHGKYQQEAQANARIALMMAIGQLQNYAGPDQRVTAPADMFSAGGGNIKQPLWTGVWRSDQMPGTSGNTPPSPILTRNKDTGSWVDARTSGAKFDASNAIAWLVSGENADPTTTIPKDSIILQKNFTALNGDQVPEVQVPLVSLSNSKQISGKIAWFTDDLATKANLTLDNRFRPDSLPKADEVASYFAPYGYGNFKEPSMDSLTENDVKKLFSLATVGIPSQSKDLGEQAQRDFTSFSTSLLTDTRMGGYKKDLSAFCESKTDLADWTSPIGNHYRAYQQDDAIIRDELNPDIDSSWHHRFGAKWGLIRSWYRLQYDVTESGSGATQTSKIEVHPPHNKRYSLIDLMTKDSPTKNRLGNSIAVPDLENYNKAPVHPVMVMVDNQMVPCFDGSAAPVKDTIRDLRLKFFPRVVLWNPYNVTLKTQGYYVQGAYPWKVKIIFKTEGYDGDNIDGSTTMAAYNDGKYDKASMDLDFSQQPASRSSSFKNPIYQPIYFLEPTEIGPGESVMFTPSSDTEWTENTQPDQMKLSAKGGHHAFVIKDDLFVTWPGTSNMNRVKILKSEPSFKLDFKSHRCDGGRLAGTLGKQRMWHLFQAPSSGGTWESIHKNTDTLLQSIYQSEDGYMATDALVDVLPSARIHPEDSAIMPNQGRFTHRWRYLTENPVNASGVSSSFSPDAPFKSSPMANFNVRANWCIPTPLNLFSRSNDSEGSGRHIFDHYMSAMSDAPMTDGNMTPYLGKNGKNAYSPFGYSNAWGGVNQFVLFDIPKPSLGVLSLGMLQHLSFSMFTASPSYSLGNSYADIRYSQDMTSPPASMFTSGKWEWYQHGQEGGTGVVAITRFPHNTYFPILSTSPPSKELVNCDLTYEMNQALWDGYFFSNGKYATSSWKPEVSEWLSPYYQVTSADTSAKDCFQDKKEAFHHAAEYLSVPGGFNVNSTSIPAWKAFLSSCAQKDKAYKGGSDKGNVFFSRTHPAIGNAFDPSSDDMSSQSAWNGYRSLSDSDLELLATEIVKQVKLRGPFISVADFVNRRLIKDSDLGKSGALQAAIDAAKLNTSLVEDSDGYQAFYERAKEGDVFYNNGTGVRPSRDGIAFITSHAKIPFENLEAMPNTRVRHSAAFLQQGDLLQALGPRIQVRGDTFRIRAYGDSRDAQGNIKATAWIEAICQRTTKPVSPKWDGIGPEPTPQSDPTILKEWGRSFEIIKFRWLNKNEI